MSQEESLAPGRVLGLRVGRLALVLGSLFLAVHLVLPQLAGLEETGERIAQASWWLLGVTLGLETISFLAYGELTRSVLVGGGTRVRRSLMQRIAVVGASLGKTLPGGSPAATAVTVRILTSQGVTIGPALAGLAAAGVLSSAVLGLLLVPASGAAFFSGHGGAFVLGAAGAAAGVVVAAGLVPVAGRSPERTAGWVRRGAGVLARGPMGRWVEPDRIAESVTKGLRSLKILSRDRSALAQIGWWASLNWLADMAVLAVLAQTFGAGPALLSVPLVYVIGNLTAALPLTPGGVGVVEPVMIAAMTAAGSPAVSATAAVLGWRLISHWLPIGAGVVLLPSLLRRTP